VFGEFLNGAVELLFPVGRIGVEHVGKMQPDGARKAIRSRLKISGTKRSERHTHGQLQHARRVGRIFGRNNAIG